MNKEHTRTSSLHCIGQTVPDMNTAARRAMANVSGVISAAKTIFGPALMQWKAPRLSYARERPRKIIYLTTLSGNIGRVHV